MYNKCRPNSANSNIVVEVNCFRRGILYVCDSSIMMQSIVYIRNMIERIHTATFIWYQSAAYYSKILGFRAHTSSCVILRPVLEAQWNWYNLAYGWLEGNTSWCIVISILICHWSVTLEGIRALISMYRPNSNSRRYRHENPVCI
jgi:hypothetical protein